MNAKQILLYLFLAFVLIGGIILAYIFVPTNTIDIAKTILSIVFVITMVVIFIISSIQPEGNHVYKKAIQYVMLPLIGLCALGIFVISNVSEEAHNFDDYLVFLTIGISSLSLIPFMANPRALCNAMTAP